MADFRILGVSIDGQGRVRVEHESEPASYYVLRRGVDAGAIAQPVALGLGGVSPGALTDPGPIPATQGFYRVQQIPSESPLDTDGDGMDDVFELLRPEFRFIREVGVWNGELS